MPFAAFLRMILSIRDQWAGVEAWRQRRAELVKPSRPTYDSHPDRVEQPDMWLSIHSRDAFGRILTEPVDLRGYSVNHINFEAKAWPRDLAKAIEASRTVLRARLRLSSLRAAKQRAHRADERAQRAYAQAMQKEARGKNEPL